ncbi:sporulation membrane protein YtaF [Cytobacillus sp. S13-E01]|uniref:sporulation membrane protein YtaF n=1 Tax=Cytobacillus sp. S13-E01 TaxID=3031326 RepID=UPI0023D8AA1F|nr:sporulation membrane protein YtaF [Cytobacillus sp. S13-E01]MDF0727495.1 sporulation membrane protein YtaF [Cytobacillus sp. S13-E01]
MVQYLSLVLLAFAVSLDSFSVGFTYGLRKMQIPFKSIIIIASCSALTLLLAMGVGNTIATVISPDAADKIGGLVLVLIGAWVLLQFFRPSKQSSEQNEEKILINFEIKSLGVVINILRKPLVADFDKSGTITGIEAFMLGLALSLDAFGAGVGAALLGYSPWLMALFVALMSSLFVTLGIKSGRLFSELKWVQKFSFIPGILLIVIGVWKF